MGQNVVIKDVLGLTPAIDPTRTDKLFALRGKNYVFDSIGVKSDYGSRLLSTINLDNPEHAQGIRVKLITGDRGFLLTTWGIFEWNESAGCYLNRFILQEPISLAYRWTHAYLNGRLFFAHPSVGIVVHEVDSELFVRATGPGVPEFVIGITADNGRLIALTEEALLWSNQSDGLDFTPMLGGAGYQVVSDRVSGNPLMVTSYAEGLLTWTSGGIMRSQFVGGVDVYRHVNIDTEYRPMNSMCVVKMSDNSTVILDERGLFQSSGRVPEPLTPMFNEFLIEFIKDNKLRIGQNIRLEWDDLRRRLYLSYSFTYASPIYEKAFVLYPPLDKWGEFNESHYAILPSIVANSSRAGDYFGYIDTAGNQHFWLQAGNREIFANQTGLNLVNRTEQGQMEEIPHSDGCVSLSSTWEANTLDFTIAAGTSGFYVEGSSAPAAPQVRGLDSYVKIGLLRGGEDLAPDMMTEICKVLIRSGLSDAQAGVESTFDLTASGGQDYNLTNLNPGFEPLTYVDHTLRIISTIDGVNEFLSAVPELVAFTKAVRIFSCTTQGIWHIVEIGAETPGQAYHVKSLELTAVTGGLLT